jgi:hypothetical protein
MKLKYIAMFACLFVACSQSTSAPVPAPTLGPSASQVPSPTVSDDDVTPLAQHASQKPFVRQPDPRTPAQIANAACRRADGSWACAGIKAPLMAGGTQIPPPSWGVPNWYLDFANSTGCASDANSGTSATCSGAGIGPLLTVTQLYARWGTHSPALNPGTGTVITVMSSQPAGSKTADPWGTFAAGSPVGLVEIIGQLQPVGATCTDGAVTAISRGNPGNDWQAAAGTCTYVAGQIIFNSSVAGGSYAWIDSVGGGTATLTPPMAASSITTVTNNPTVTLDGASWTVGGGDTIQLYTVPTIWIDNIATVTGTNSVIGGASGLTWLQWFNIGQAGGGTGLSGTAINPTGITEISMVRSDAGMKLNGYQTNGAIEPAQVISPWFNGGVESNGDVNIYGGAWGTAGVVSGVLRGTVLQLMDDVIAHGSNDMEDGSVVSAKNVHVPSGTWTVQPGTAIALRVGVANGCMWGAGALETVEGGVVSNKTGGGLWANNLLLSALKINSNGGTTGSTKPTAVAQFTMNGVSEVAVPSVAGAFPINAPIWWSLATVGSTPCASGPPYFDKAQAAGQFFVKSVTANCNDVYNWQAGPVDGITLNAANLDTYGALTDRLSGSIFTNP